MRFVGVVPARFASTRLPGKPLLQIAGKPLIQWVYEAASQASCLEQILVATDDERILRTVLEFGGRAVMTRSDHQSGTDRVAEVATCVDADVFVNVQGDEPLMPASTIEAVCRPFFSNPELQISTARIRIADQEEAEKPQVVKVVTDAAGRALYFSRSLIPFARREPATWYKHIGIYAYRRRFLLSLPELKPSPLETTECLEQLRFLENGHTIQVVEVTEDSLGIDTPEDLERVRPLLQNRLAASSSVKNQQSFKRGEEE
jgi:3-deoxy-manno-octulosonate cytidylyltransferase (CMP-KDO synthetase)